MTVMLELPPDLEERSCAEESETAPPRVAGLNRGQIWVSEDFDAPLADEFWLGQK